jgi:hypothetical protein
MIVISKVVFIVYCIFKRYFKNFIWISCFCKNLQGILNFGVLMKTILMFALLAIVSLMGCSKSNNQSSHKLIITSDFNSVRRCSTVDDVNAVAQIIISAKPDIVVLDLTANGLVNYKSDIGFLIPGSNFDALFNAGYEPASIIVDTLRNHGITVLANVRMNDHHGRPIQWTPWEREHKQWSLAKDTGARDWKSIGALRHMDHAIEGVRDHRFSILEEIVEKFNVDGLQLDFGRTAPFLSEPKIENARFMTEYVKRIRKLLDDSVQKRQRDKMLLGVLLPWDLDFCKNEGLQVPQWIEQELVDYLSPGEWYYADWNIPLDRWRELTKGTSCKLYPFTPGNVSPYQDFEYGEPSLLGENKILDPPQIRAIADNFWSQNPDGFALYNFYTFDFGQYYPELRTWTNPQKTEKMSKHYLYCRKLMYQPNERETFDLGVAFERQKLHNVGDSVELPFWFSTDIKNANTKLRCVFKHTRDTDEIAVRVNGNNLSPENIITKTIHSDSTADFDIQIWEGAVTRPLLKLGDNVIEMELIKSDADKGRVIEVGEFEIIINP